MLFKGQGADPDPTAAFGWYKAAAEQNLMEAQLAVGDMVANGVGTAVDTAAARRWYELAAEQGSAVARERLI